MRIFQYFLIYQFLFALTLNLHSQEFEVKDLRIGDTTVNYVNPEISPIGNYMIWMEVDTANGIFGKVWQCGIDPNTGDLIPPNGKGFNPFNSNIYARPADWGIDSFGVYYVGATFAGQIKFVRPTSPTAATVTDINLPIMNKRRVFYPSQLPGVNRRFVSYILNDSVNGFSSNTPQNSFYQLRLLDLDNTANDYLIEQQRSIFPATIPMDVIVPRWIKGSPYLTFGFRDANNKVQAKEFNAYSPTISPIPITNDLTNKIDGYPVLNSTTGEQYFMSGINATDTAYFYKRNGFGQMFIQNEVIVPKALNLKNPAFNQSHEPFLFNNKLYSTFQVNNNGGNFFETTLNQPGEIWITTIDQTPQKMWLISKYDSSLNISEPEPYIGEKVWVYYSAAKIEKNKPYLKRMFQLRRCETPFSNETNVIDKHQSFLILPNPASNYIIINSPLVEGSVGVSEIKIYNTFGNCVIDITPTSLLTGEGQRIDISHLPSGIYFIKDGDYTEKIMVLR